MDLVVVAYGYGNPSGTVQFLVVTKDDIGENRLALDSVMTSTTMTYHAAECLPTWGTDSTYDVLYVLGCQGWMQVPVPS